MIDAHTAAAAKKVAPRIVFSCGFDSIPFDLGVMYLQDRAQQAFGRVLPRVRGRVRGMKGCGLAVPGQFKVTMAAAAKTRPWARS